jgi:transcriptional regulator with XRE-family HTH domain
MTAQATDDESALPGGQPGDSSTGLERAANPLQRLIQQRLRERSWSYGEVARRGGLPRSTVYTLATTLNLVRPPRPATIDALAKGLDVPVSVVRAAAAESTGLHYYDEAQPGQPRSGDQERELLIASIDELSAEDRRHVAALVESLRRKASETPADSQRLRSTPARRLLLAAGQLRVNPGPVERACQDRDDDRAGARATDPVVEIAALCGRDDPDDQPDHQDD